MLEAINEAQMGLIVQTVVHVHISLDRDRLYKETDQTLTITVTNAGSKPISDANLKVAIPNGLAGESFSQQIGTINPGVTRTLTQTISIPLDYIQEKAVVKATVDFSYGSTRVASTDSIVSPVSSIVGAAVKPAELLAKASG
jgi:uncharacterized repeat protein (TIGR01451 family)